MFSGFHSYSQFYRTTYVFNKTLEFWWVWFESLIGFVLYRICLMKKWSSSTTWLWFLSVNNDLGWIDIEYKGSENVLIWPGSIDRIYYNIVAFTLQSKVAQMKFSCSDLFFFSVWTTHAIQYLIFFKSDLVCFYMWWQCYLKKNLK